jgi:hypothetical protein
MLEIGHGNPGPFLAGDRTGTSCAIPIFIGKKILAVANDVND